MTNQHLWQPSRRALLAGILPVMIGISGCGGGASGALGKDALLTVTQLLRDMFPHRSLAAALYASAAENIATNARGSARTALQDGLDALNDSSSGAWRALPADQRLAALQKIAGTPFFNQLRFSGLVALYGNLNVTRNFGYQGPSWEEGGYLGRGFNDLNWLPDPK